MDVERISIELTNRCSKACWFCYNHSTPGGASAWALEELVEFVQDCAAGGVRAVSFGGGEPLEYEGVFDLLRRLDGVLFRSLTTNGLPLLRDEVFAALIDARPDKVHVSIHFPHNAREVDRVIGQVDRLASQGVRSGINLLVERSKLEHVIQAAATIRSAGIDNDRIVYLPMRGQDTPTPRQVATVAGDRPFQSMSCLGGCAASPRFCSIAWDRTVAWCSYTTTRRKLTELTFRGLCEALEGLDLQFCGGTDAA